MSDTLWTSEQIAQWLGVHPKTLVRLRRRGMPYHALGGRTIRYDVAEVKAWLQRRRELAGAAR